MIKFWSYKKEYKKFRGEILKNIDITLSRGVTFFLKEIKKFEKNFLKKYNSKYGVAVGSGTEALLISLKALDIKKGDEIITAANTAIPTISAIVNSGAKPKLVDIGEDYLIDCTKIEREINKKTKAIIPVHLYGQSCDMGKISRLAKRYNLKLLRIVLSLKEQNIKIDTLGLWVILDVFHFIRQKFLGLMEMEVLSSQKTIMII